MGLLERHCECGNESPSSVFRVIKPRRLRWAGHEGRIEEGISAFKILTGKPTRKKPLGMPIIARVPRPPDLTYFLMDKICTIE